jgi:small-conductance mechanosensitive channel
MKQDYITYTLIVVISLLSATILSLVLRKIVNTFMKKYSGKLSVEMTNLSFIKNSISAVVYSMAVYVMFANIPYLSALGNALFAGAGVLAAIIGFASQKAFSNIISGVFILIFKPFRVNDTIESTTIAKGIVEEITLRHTVIRDYENRRIVVPNSKISDETIINSDMEESLIRKHIVFSISYDSDIDLAMSIIRKHALAHPLCLDNRSDEAKEAGEEIVITRVVGLKDFSVEIKAYVWAKSNDDAFVLYTEILKSVKEEFDRSGIEIPFPYRTIVMKKDKKSDEEK